MMRYCVYIYFLIIPFLSNSQVFEFGLHVTPSLSYRISSNSQNNPNAQSIEIGEKGIYTFDFGVDLKRSLGTRWKIGTGLLYSQKGFANNNVGAIYQLDFPEISHIDYVQDYLEVPLFLNYLINPGEKLEYYASLGITNAFLLNDKNNVIFRSQLIADKDYTKLQEPYLNSNGIYHFGIRWGMGTQFSIDEKYSFGLEPIFKLSFTELEESRFETSRKLISLGLDFRFIKRI